MFLARLIFGISLESNRYFGELTGNFFTGEKINFISVKVGFPPIIEFPMPPGSLPVDAKMSKRENG